MPAHVYTNGAWREATSVFVYDNGAWREASDMPVYANGAWRTATLAAPQTIVNITSSDVEYNLFDRIGAITGDIVVNIAAGVNIDSTDAEIPAFDIGHEFPGANITINNAGTIRGVGGRQGVQSIAHSARPGTAGQAGGTALYVRTTNPVTLNNTGRIGGGGGGGGSGGSSYYTWRARSTNRNAAFGYYCSAPNAGARGFGPTPGNPTWGQYIRVAPSRIGPINLSAGNVSHFSSSLRGGRGGGSGMPGGEGGATPLRAGPPSNVTSYRLARRYNPEPGGRAGYSIDGISNVNIVTAGETSGPQVN